MAVASLGPGTTTQVNAEGTGDDTFAVTGPVHFANDVKMVQKAGSDKFVKSKTKTSVRSASTGSGQGARGSSSAWEGAVERRRSKSPTTTAVVKKSAGVRWPWMLT